MTQQMEQLKQLFADYIDFANALPRESTLQKLLTDHRSSPSEDPGHQQFYNNVAVWTAEFAAGSPSSEEIRQVVEFILFAAPEQQDKMSYWYLIAVQRHTLELIPGMEPSDRISLAPCFEAAYPKATRVPVQLDILDLLRGQTRKKGLLERLFS